MATATALFGVPCTILEGAGLEPWEATEQLDEAPAPEMTGLQDASTADPQEYEYTENPLADDVEEATPSTSLTDFQGLSVKQLRELAKVLGVSATGNKAALVERVTTSLLPLGMAELPLPFTHLTPWFAQ